MTELKNNAFCAYAFSGKYNKKWDISAVDVKGMVEEWLLCWSLNQAVRV